MRCLASITDQHAPVASLHSGSSSVLQILDMNAQSTNLYVMVMKNAAVNNVTNVLNGDEKRFCFMVCVSGIVGGSVVGVFAMRLAFHLIAFDGNFFVYRVHNERNTQVDD